MFEKLLEHANITQIYVNDTAYILENRNETILNTVKKITELMNSSDINFNQHISENLKTFYKSFWSLLTQKGTGKL